jgi:hypothetical protein
MKEGDGAAKTAQPPLIISSNSPNRSFLELFQKTVLIAEANLANRLGNLGLLKRCQGLEHFSAARDEWFTAWRTFLGTKGMAAFASEKEPTLEAMKNYFLEMLRISDQPEALLQNQAAVIYRAACEGDADFFRNIGHAFRGHARARREGAPLDLDWCILSYWFAGLLWLMSAEVGSGALREYLKTHSTTPSRSVVPIEAYRKVCSRLKLKGYKAFTTMPPVLDYLPKQKKRYQYRKDWTHLEPELSRC